MEKERTVQFMDALSGIFYKSRAQVLPEFFELRLAERLRQRVGRRVAPVCAGRAAFQKREAVRVEQAAAVGGQTQLLVIDAVVDGADVGRSRRGGCARSSLFRPD